jgi:modulator of FtsH protease HflK
MAWNEPGPNRDPWSQGPRRGNGPPDLDELLKRLKARFGGKGGGGGAPGSGAGLPSGMMWLLGLVLLGLWLASGFYVVDEQERAVVLRFGQHVGTSDPGLRWHIPWPVEREEVVNVTGVRSVRDQAVMLTRDENIIDVELTVQYRVMAIEDYVFNVADPDMTLRQAVKASLREVVGTSEMDFILTAGRQEVAARTKQLLQDRLESYKTGLIVTEVNLQNAQPPQAVQSAFADAIKAREDQQRLKNEAEAYANDRLPRARGAAARLMEEAKGYREQVIARAEGDASRFTQLVREYRKAPKVTRERLYLETMSQVLGANSKILVDVDSGSPVFYLPLDQLMKSAPRSDSGISDLVTVPGVSGSRSGVPPTPSDSSRSRERTR